MNNIQSSSMSKLYLSLYDYAYELEYDCVLIMFIVYELVLSSYAMFLICSTLFFIVHQISMIRIRIRNEMMVPCVVMAALSLAVDGGYTIEIHIQNTVNMPRLQWEMT